MNVTVNGAELFYTTRGEGPACLVLSGVGTRLYELMMPPQLSDRLKLVFVDLRGSGRSTGTATDLTFDTLAEDLDAIREDVGVERVAVLGHSILGVLAIEYGRRRPGSVSHVVAVGLPPIGDMAVVGARAAAFFEEDASEERKQLLRENLASLPAGASVTQAMIAQSPLRFFERRIDAAPLYSEIRSTPALLRHVMATLAPGWDIASDAGSLPPRILLAHGRYDYTVPCVLWDGIATTLPGTTLHLFNESGHHPFFEEPNRFTEVLMSWMGNQP